MKKLLHKEALDWKGTTHDLELYESDSVEGLRPIKQVQAVPFIDEKQIVIYKHVDGYYGLPGGSIEHGETVEEALRREIQEESGCAVESLGLIGYVRDIQIVPPGHEKYQLRYWAKVYVADEVVNDPCGKALAREIVSLEEAEKKLNWGERGRILLELARKEFLKANS